MKKSNWIYIVLILLSGAAFVGYSFLQQVTTDDRPPEITVSGPLTLSVYDSEDAYFAGVKAKDAKDGDVSASLVVESITMTDPDSPLTVVYAAFDKSGNVAKAERQVTFSDYVGPRLKLNRSLTYPAGNNFDVMDAVTAEDVLDGDITRRVRGSLVSEGNLSNQGKHLVEFRVTNSLGDTVRYTLPVEVYSADVYVAAMRLTDYLIYLPQGAAFNPRDYLLEFTMLNQKYWLRGENHQELEVKIDNGVDTSVPGVYEVAYTIIGTSRAENYAAYAKLIVIVEG